MIWFERLYIYIIDFMSFNFHEIKVLTIQILLLSVKEFKGRSRLKTHSSEYDHKIKSYS